MVAKSESVGIFEEGWQEITRKARSSAIDFLLHDKEEDEGREHGSKHEHSGDGTLEGYGSFEFNRPPFKLNAAPEDAIYLEACEEFCWEIENTVFDVENLPTPPSDASEKLWDLYSNVIRAHTVMMRDIQAVKDLNEYDLKRSPNGVARSVGYRITRELKFRVETPRKRRKNHFESKMYYLLARRAYAHAMRTDTNQDERSREEAERCFQETALIALCHILTNVVKTACHTKRSARRKSGRLVMMHSYRVAMSAFNEHEEAIRNAEGQKEVRAAFEALTLDAAAKIMHDFEEDFGKSFNDGFMAKKENQYLLNSMPLQAAMADVPHLSGNKTLQSQVEPLNDIGKDLFKLIRMLVKPSRKIRTRMNVKRIKEGKKPQLEPHLEEKTRNAHDLELGLRAFKIKLDDRRDNIETLVPAGEERKVSGGIRQNFRNNILSLVKGDPPKRMSVRSQLKKIIEARELIQTGYTVIMCDVRYTQYPDELNAIRDKLIELHEACNRQLNRISLDMHPRHPQYEVYQEIRRCVDSREHNHDTYAIGEPLLDEPLVPEPAELAQYMALAA